MNFIDKTLEEYKNTETGGVIRIDKNNIKAFEQGRAIGKEQGRKELIAEMKSGKSVYYRGYLGENVIKNLTKN